ncbi:peptidase [Bradyrhizobium sp. CCBAU 53340]|nr:peptidase [Bradyrhizobium sp. CCBAU 53340]
MHVRRAPVRATTFDSATGAFSAVIATDTPVARRDGEYGDYFEVLSLAPASVRLDRLKSGASPILDSHRSGSARDQIGVVTDARIEAGQLVADARLSPRDDVKGIATDLAAGTPPNVSVGYRVYASVESRDREGRLIITRTDWEPFEVSLVAIPADPKTHVRNQKGISMPKKHTIRPTDSHEGDHDADTVVAQRGETGQDNLLSRDAIAILDHAAARGMSVEFARQHIAEGSTIHEFRLAVLDEMAERASRLHINSRTDSSATFDNPDFTARMVGDVLYARMTGTRPEGAAAELAGKSLLDLGAMMLEQRGERPNWRNRDQLANQILTRAGDMTTSDFPNLLTASGHRVLNQSYQVAQTPLLQLCKRRDAVDFRALTQVKLSEAPRLLEVKESGEVKHGARSESAESFKLKTYARIFSISRQAIVNDDLGAFADSASAFGRAAAQTESDLLVSLLTANSGNGANLADNVALYDAAHGNKAAAAGGIGISTLSDGRQAMRSQKDIDGKTLISVSPKYLVVGSQIETIAEQFLHTISAVDSTKVNPFGGKLTLLVEPRLSGLAWRLFCDPAEVACLMVAYLNGADGPMVEQRLGWDVLGLEIRAVLDVGFGLNDFRGTYLNPGA